MDVVVVSAGIVVGVVVVVDGGRVVVACGLVVEVLVVVGGRVVDVVDVLVEVVVVVVLVDVVVVEVGLVVVDVEVVAVDVVVVGGAEAGAVKSVMSADTFVAVTYSKMTDSSRIAGEWMHDGGNVAEYDLALALNDGVASHKNSPLTKSNTAARTFPSPSLR